MYNCEKQVVRVLDKINKSKLNIDKVLVVDNGSQDNGIENIQKYLNKNTFVYDITVMQNKNNYGLGGSHKVAFKYAIENEFGYVITVHS